VWSHCCGMGALNIRGWCAGGVGFAMRSDVQLYWYHSSNIHTGFGSMESTASRLGACADVLWGHERACIC
jgi:hypothetical protein